MPLLEDFVDEVVVPVIGTIDQGINMISQEIAMLRLMLPRIDIADMAMRVFDNGQTLVFRTIYGLKRQSTVPFISELAQRYLNAPKVYCLTLADIRKVAAMSNPPGIYIRVVEFGAWETHSDTASVSESITIHDRSPSSMSGPDDLNFLRDEILKLQQEVYRLKAVVDNREASPISPPPLPAVVPPPPPRVAAPPPPPPPPLPMNFFSKPAVKSPVPLRKDSPEPQCFSFEANDENTDKKPESPVEQKSFGDVLAELKSVRLRHVENLPRIRRSQSNPLKEAMKRRRFAFQENSESEVSDSDASFS
uniref:Protein cappuccino n=1 Tax=Panagrellus redivivus TaxID=6233 RepID=A0A7E4ZZJ8_PANRE